MKNEPCASYPYVTEKLQEVLSCNLRALRLLNGYTQEYVSAAASISRSTYRRIECGFAYPDVPTLCFFLKFYSISFEELVCEPLVGKFLNRL